GQHHGRHRAVRRGRAALGHRGGRGGPSGIPADRHGDEHRARAGLSGEPAAVARTREPLACRRRGPARGGRGGRRALSRDPEPVTAQFRFLSGARAGAVATFRKAYIGLGRHPLSYVRFDAERDLDVSSRHAAIVRHGEAFSIRGLALAGFGWSQWEAARDARDLVALRARADSSNREARRLLSRFQSELESVRDALRESQAEVARLRGELATAGSGSGAPSVARLRAQLDTAEARQRGLAGAAAVDYRAISRNNQDAVALLAVTYSVFASVSG